MPRKRKYIHHHCQHGSGLMDGLSRVNDIVRDNQLISRGVQAANSFGLNAPIINAGAAAASQMGYGQAGGSGYRLAVMPPMFEDNRMIGSGKRRKRKRRQRGTGWREALSGAFGLAPMVAGSSLLGMSQGISSGIGGILGSF